MSSCSVNAQSVSKTYRLGSFQGPYRTLRESINGAFAAPYRYVVNRRRRAADEADKMLWALSSVSFEIGQGEVVGIIGRNGAGKSTLLKILSRITKPSSGRIDVYGRIGSLLEVGSGFHPELTGRENIFLNGAILGMRRSEIIRQFDEIVAFAEVERFIDTPVKRYSSGMYLRLAFAVAAHLDPEILVVDEVLAVGDAAFQKKCIGRMNSISRTDGRTVIFVSHNMSAIKSICDRAFLLESGRLVFDGDIEVALSKYASMTRALVRPREPGESNGVIQINSVDVIDAGGRPIGRASINEPIGVRIDFDPMSSSISNRTASMIEAKVTAL